MTIYSMEVQVVCFPYVHPDSFTPVYSKDPPTPIIHEITAMGRVTIHWNSTMEKLYRSENSTRILDDSRGIIGLPSVEASDFDWISNQTIWIDGEEVSPIELKLLNVDQSMSKRLSFTWELIEYNAT